MAGELDEGATAGGPVGPGGYTFGDGVRAVQRLALLANTGPTATT